MLVAGLAVAACGGDDAPTRSKQQFCSTYADEKSKFLTQYGDVGSHGDSASGAEVLTDLILALQSVGDVSVILDKLDKVAPNDIEPDVAAVRDSWSSMRDTMGDEASNMFNVGGLVGSMAKGLLMSVESNGSWQRVGDYITENCDTQ